MQRYSVFGVNATLFGYRMGNATGFRALAMHGIWDTPALPTPTNETRICKRMYCGCTAQFMYMHVHIDLPSQAVLTYGLPPHIELKRC